MHVGNVLISASKAKALNSSHHPNGSSFFSLQREVFRVVTWVCLKIGWPKMLYLYTYIHTLHYITLHYIHTYIHMYKYIYISSCSHIFPINITLFDIVYVLNFQTHPASRISPTWFRFHCASGVCRNRWPMFKRALPGLPTAMALWCKRSVQIEGCG
jgi:hypothetical protein